MQDWIIFLVIAFVVGYLAITLEAYIKVNKAAIAIFAAVICWGVYLSVGNGNVHFKMDQLSHHVASMSEVVFFLMGAMTIVEMIDSHHGFAAISRLVNVSSKSAMLWIVGLLTFFLSSVLDNLTTTIVMVALLRKIIDDDHERKVFGGLVVIAANAGGAWTPIGDVTTTMLWIKELISTANIMKSLFLPSFVCLVVSVLLLQTQMKKGKLSPAKTLKKADEKEVGGKRVLLIGLLALILVPFFKAQFNLPPFLGVFVGVAALWLFTDLVHPEGGDKERLRMPHALARIDKASLLFFWGILLAVGALETVGVLGGIARWLEATIPNQDIVVVVIGLISAIIDNVPLVAATMGMYDVASFPMDCRLWELIAYCAGTGGSILVIGSAAGVAFMGMEKVDFIWYMRRIGWVALIAYFAGIGTYTLMN